ncbi:MAG: rhodanese-like domain-containing protein [Ginsengibacter sp.]|jgi:rhodanese-related sulfurtransferase
MDIEKLIKEDCCVIVDVRSPEEYQYGNVPGSVNIPLGEIVERLEEIKEIKAPLVLCCASGARSGRAAEFLSLHEIECYNGGSWLDLNFNKLKIV